MAFKKLRGKAWIFGDVVDVDKDIFPSDVVDEIKEKHGLLITPETGAKYVMTTLDPDFPNKVKKGDFIVAGESMGYGSDHDRSSMALLGAGVGAVICESTNGNFYRNTIDWGVPVVECPGFKKNVKEGDELELDLKGGIVKDLANGATCKFDPYPEFLLEMLADGGLYPHLKKQGAKGEYTWLAGKENK
jgi:3-isopropylmalate/(R)-2-methylmalate dehydratase small subunit